VEWSDEAIILNAERYGEADCILDVMTPEHGRHRGYVKGGMGRRQRANLQPGNEVAISWRARVEDQLGRFTLEPKRARVADLLISRDRLTAFLSAAALLVVAMPERESHQRIYNGLIAFLDLLADEAAGLIDYGAGLVRLELGVLGELGFGLDLAACASTGVTEDLIYVSPKSGRAVSRDAGAPYQEKLLALPGFLIGGNGTSPQDVAAGLALTGYFLERHMQLSRAEALAQARASFAALFAVDSAEKSA
jgi:DNA repair protein RecO (recombination protein O)